MRERLIFHLRLEDRASPVSHYVGRAEEQAEDGSARPSRQGPGVTPPTPKPEAHKLVCTCIDSSSSSCIIVGFKRGVVHMYERYPQAADGERLCCEEEHWKHTVFYPTRTLGDSCASSTMPDITCVQRAPHGMLAIGTSNGYVFVMQTPSRDGSSVKARMSNTGFHHKSHRGSRVNCLLWDPSGDRLFSVCEGGTVILARNLRQKRDASAISNPAGMGNMVNTVMSFYGMDPPEALSSRGNGRRAPATPQAIIVGQLGSPGVQLDLGRVKTSLPGVKRDCDVLLIMTRQRAVLLYFAVGEDVSIIAPYQASVDLNVLPQDPREENEEEKYGTEVSGGFLLSLGGCLWGPSATHNTGTSTILGSTGSLYGPGALGDQPLRQAWSDLTVVTPRAVVFAYVAQPGGKLWRVGLSDGEVESTHLLPPLYGGGDGSLQDIDEASAVAEGLLEIGNIWTVQVGEAQVILCWRHRPSDGKSGLALLNPMDHTLKCACGSLGGIVDLSGNRLDGTLNLGDASAPTSMPHEAEQGRSTAVHILRGGDVAKVTQLLATRDDLTRGSLNLVSSCLPTYGPSAEAAAIKLQRLWRDRREKRLASWRNSIVRSYSTLSPHAVRRSANTPPIPKCDTRAACLMVDRRPSATHVHDDEALTISASGRENDGFSVLDSLGALDAAERALRLTGQSCSLKVDVGMAMTSSSTSGVENDIVSRKGWSPDVVLKRTNTSDSGLDSAKATSEGARALVQTADALLRETAPVLNRSRSIAVFSPQHESPYSGSKQRQITEGWEGSMRGTPMAAALDAEAQRVDELAKVTAELPDEDIAAQIRSNHTIIMSTVEDAERKWKDAVTNQGSTPPASHPSEPEEDDNVQEHGQEPHLNDMENEAPASMPPSTEEPGKHKPSPVPYPRGQANDATLSWEGPGITSPRSIEREMRRHSSPSPSPKHLLTPVQNVVGSLFQRSVQAVNSAFQPGGGAMSDDSSPYEDEDDPLFRHERDSGSHDGEARRPAGSKDERLDSVIAKYGNDAGGECTQTRELMDCQADGGTTSDTGKQSYSNSWGFSSDRSEDDIRIPPIVGHSRSSSVGDGSHGNAMRDSRLLSVPLMTNDNSRGGRSRTDSVVLPQSGRKDDVNKDMLFVSGMIGVKRHPLGTLRYRRNTMVKMGEATVIALPPSIAQDPTSFVPPSQYEVQLNVSRGLGLSLQITGNDVRVKGFSTVEGGEMGPAEECGQIQAGDALRRVNHQELHLLSHYSVVEVLRGLLRMNSDQVLLLRFESSQHLQRVTSMPLPTRAASQSWMMPSTSSTGSTAYQPRIRPAIAAKDDSFRPDSWRGSRSAYRPTAGGKAEQGTHDGREQARSVSPPHFAERGSSSNARLEDHGLSLARSLSRRHSSGHLSDGSGQAKMGLELGLNARAPASAGVKVRNPGSEAVLNQEYVEGTIMSQGGGGSERGRGGGELWGHFSGGLGSSRHVYLGDMGHARTQRTLGYMAQDLQGLYNLQDASEISRFFQGRSRLSLADPSPSASENRTPPPSVILAISHPHEQKTPIPQTSLNAPSGEDDKQAPLVPQDLYRGRRRRRTRRARRPRLSSNVPAEEESVTGGSWDDENGTDMAGLVIDLPLCRGVVTDELSRLESGLKKQTARLARRNRRSNLNRLVTNILVEGSSRSGHSGEAQRPRTSYSRRGRAGRSTTAMNVCKDSSIDLADTYRATSEGWSDGLTDSDDDLRVYGGAGESYKGGEPLDCVPGRGQDPSGDVEIWDPGRADGESWGPRGCVGAEPACDIFSEAVSTVAMEQELLSKLAVEMLGVSPPRPLPADAYDLQTALESVQHLATQTLAGVVQSEATRGLDLDVGSAFQSISPSRGGGILGLATGETREIAAAAGQGESWESAWPPRELTAALGLVTARQMAHAMRCDSEPLIQIWMRCFTPLCVRHRDRLWGALSPSPMDSDEVISGMFHRQLVCGLITLYAQVHISWPFLVCPADDPSAVGLRSLRLESTWFSVVRDGSGTSTDATNMPRGRCDTMDAPSISVAGAMDFAGAEPVSTAWGLDSDPGAGLAGGGDGRDMSWSDGGAPPRGPEQWDEEKVVDFIQEYGCYLDADPVAAAVSCREMVQALDEILKLAGKCTSYKEKERTLHELLRGPRAPISRSPMIDTTSLPRSPKMAVDTRSSSVTSPTSASMRNTSGSSGNSSMAMSSTLDKNAPGAAEEVGRPMEEDAVRKALGLMPARHVFTSIDFEAAYLTKESRAPSEGNGGSASWGSGIIPDAKAEPPKDQPPGSAPLCLLLNNLGEIFRWDAASAAEMCADAFPGVRPWNIHLALYQDLPWGGGESAMAGRPGGPLNTGSAARLHFAADDAGIRNDAAFHAYLWATMTKHPRECLQDWKMVQRCLQLSLRIAAKLQLLPKHHPLHTFCRAATRNMRWNSRAHGARRVGHGKVSFADVRQDLTKPIGSRGNWRSNLGRASEARRLGGGDSRDGKNDDDSASRRYLRIVESVSSTWCRDPDAFALNPLWLVQKLRAYRKWPLVFQVCAAIARSWEEDQHSDIPDKSCRTYGAILPSTLMVLDTLVEACFVSFEDGDSKCLSSALCAMWGAEGALRKSTVRHTGNDVTGANMWGSVSPWGRGAPSKSDVERHSTRHGSEFESASHSARSVVAGLEEKSSPSTRELKPDGECSTLQIGHCHDEEGNASGERLGDISNREPNTNENASWIEGSKTVDVVRTLTERCRDYAAQSKGVGIGDIDATNISMTAKEGHGAWVASEDTDGWTAVLSLLELGEALADGVGPEAAGDVLAACPRLIEGLPAKFFRGLADRQAALCRQQALEATLLDRVMSIAWAQGGINTSRSTLLGSENVGIWGMEERSNPLGPRLAWLACEELTSFFNHNVNPLARGRTIGMRMTRSEDVRYRAVRRLFAAKGNGDTHSDANRGQGQRSGVAQEAVCRAIMQAGLNLLFPNHAHYGITLLMGSVCMYCGLSLDGGPRSVGGFEVEECGVSDAKNVDMPSDVFLSACGHGCHARCMREGMTVLGQSNRRELMGRGKLGMMYMPCANCR